MNILPSPKGMPRILTARFDKLAPDADLAAAEKAGAWTAWKKTAGSMNPPALVRLVAESGLRGRGGGGYPTGDKWRAAASTDSDERYVVANGFEADPGARLDRTLADNAQFARNSNIIQSRLNYEESSLADATGLLQAARDLALAGANSSLGPPERRMLANDVRQQLSALLDVANRDDSNGEFLFSGTSTATRPFAISSTEAARR